MLKFLMANWVSILIITGCTGYALFLAITKQWAKLRAGAYKLVLEAEKVILGSKRGQEKFEYVFSRLYLLVPAWLQIFVSEEILREKLQEWFDQLKDYLEDGKLNGNSKPPDAPAV